MAVCITFYHQASLAKKLLGNFLTTNLRPSSNNSSPIPKAIGRNQYSAGITAVFRTVWNFGTYVKKMAMTRAKQMAGRRYQFILCVKTEILRTRTAKILNHCLSVC